jgi:hypothetical protein
VAFDLNQSQADLELRLVDTVRISRITGTPDLDPHTGQPGETPTTVVYEGPGAVLSTHGQIVFAQILETDWASQSAAWYQLITPLAAEAARPGDQVEVTASAAPSAATVGRVWLADAATQVSTWEIARVTRLTEQPNPADALS